MLYVWWRPAGLSADDVSTVFSLVPSRWWGGLNTVQVACQDRPQNNGPKNTTKQLRPANKKQAPAEECVDVCIYKHERALTIYSVTCCGCALHGSSGQWIHNRA